MSGCSVWSYLAEVSCKLQFLSPTIMTGSSKDPYTEENKGKHMNS